MAQIKIKISPGLLTLDSRIKRRVGIGQQAIADLLEINIKQQINAVGAVASKALINSVERKSAPPNIVRVGTDKVQGPVVEEGRKPGEVPPWSRFKKTLQS